MDNTVDMTTDPETVYDRVANNSYEGEYSCMLTRDEVTALYISLLSIKWYEYDKSERRYIIRKLIQSQYEPPMSKEIFDVADTIKEYADLEDIVDQKV